MEGDADWAANALFSPSKARIAQAQARDWGFVDAWLAKRYGGKRIPQFERNDETLEALLALATQNEGADEQRMAVDRVEQSALHGFDRQRTGQAEDVYQSVTRYLEPKGEENLDLLAQTAVVLSTPPSSDIVSFVSAFIELQTGSFVLHQQHTQLKDQLAALQRESNRLRALLREIKDDAFRPSSELPEQTVEWAKGSKHLKAKIGEYDDRLSALRAAGSPSPTIAQFLQQLEQYETQQQRLAELEAELKGFQSLPTNAREARAALERARDELRILAQRRDRLFESLV
ncbi:hypothetical protein Q7P37_008631 [Cladosporium fusiforme]